MLYLMPKSPLGPPGLWLAVRMIPPTAFILRITQETAGVDMMPFWPITRWFICQREHKCTCTDQCTQGDKRNRGKILQKSLLCGASKCVLTRWLPLQGKEEQKHGKECFVIASSLKVWQVCAMHLRHCANLFPNMEPDLQTATYTSHLCAAYT